MKSVYLIGVLATFAVAFSSGLRAEGVDPGAEVQGASIDQSVDQSLDPSVNSGMAQLQALQSMRMRLEQDWSDYLGNARANTGTGAMPVQPVGGNDVGQMRAQVSHNLERMEERFRCLDVDMTGNNGNVVLVCGDNNGGIATNNQQALGADLNVRGGGL